MSGSFDRPVEDEAIGESSAGPLCTSITPDEAAGCSSRRLTGQLCHTSCWHRGAHRDLSFIERYEAHAAAFEGQTQLRQRRPVGGVAIALVVAYRAARDTRLLGEIALGPVKETARRPAKRRCQNLCSRDLTHRESLPILISINHIEHICEHFQMPRRLGEMRKG